MSKFEHDMNTAVQRFVANVADLARRAALAALTSSFSEPAWSQLATLAITTGLRGNQPRVGAGRPRGRAGSKRTPADLDTLAARFVAFVTDNPGLRIEQINARLGTRTQDLALPIRKAITSGRIRTLGKKRSTTYFPLKRTKG